MNKKKKIPSPQISMVSKVLFIFLFLSFFLQQLGRIDLGNNIALNILDIAVVSNVGYGIWRLMREKTQKWNWNVLCHPFSLFLLVCVLSLLFNIYWLTGTQLLVAFLYFLRFACYGSLFFIIQKLSKKAKQFIYRGMLVSGSLLVITGILQYVLYPDLRNLRYLGWDEHLYRLFSTFLDPNFAAVFFILFFLFLGHFLFLKNLTRKSFLLISCLGALTFISFLLTYSRGGYVTFLVSMIAFLFLIKKSRYVLLTVFILLLGILFIPKGMQSEGLKLFRTASIFARVETVQHTLVIIAAHPFIGVGFDAYRYAQYQYHFLPEHISQANHAGAGTDNSFLFVAATTGVMGLGVYLWLLFILLYTTWRESKENQNHLSLIFLISLIGLGISSFFINSLFYPAFLVWMACLWGIREYI